METKFWLVISSEIGVRIKLLKPSRCFMHHQA